MMDPSIGWYQPEQSGPALDIWRKAWNKFNPSIETCNHPNHDSSDGYHHWRSASTLWSINRYYAKNRRDNPTSTYDFDNNQYLVRRHGGTPWRKLREFYDSGIIGLHQEIEDFYNYMKPIPEEKVMRRDVYKRISKIIEDLWPENAIVDCFGSYRTETYLPTSDIDICVLGKWDTSPLLELERRLIEEGVCRQSMIRVLDRASVPIIKLTDSLTSVRINISFNMSSVFKSVQLIKVYKTQFPHLEKLVLVVKHFVLQRDLNEVFTGGISSYAIILMVINFFQMHSHVESNSANANLGVLLMEFFQLYGQLLNYDRVGLRIKDGGSYVPKAELMKNMDNGYRPSLLCIEDPLDPTNNVSKNSYGVLKVKNAFDYAYDILHRAVGPLNLTVDQTKSILGRIIRVTDEVIDYRNSIKDKFCIRNNYLNSNQSISDDHKYYYMRENRKFSHNSSRNSSSNRYRNNSLRYNQQFNYPTANLSTQFQKHKREYFRYKNTQREDYGQYQNDAHPQDDYRSRGHLIRKQRSNTFE